MARKKKAKRKRQAEWPRTSQIVFGERRSLENVLRLVRRSRMSAERRRLEASLLRNMIRLRTAELNQINPDWDRKIRQASNRRTGRAVIERLAARLPAADYYLARLLSDHPATPGPVLARLARHPYHSVRENVARHPHTPVATLRALARRKREPLWYLVAFNANAPEKLRQKLRARIARRGV